MSEQALWEIELTQLRQMMRNEITSHERIRDRVLHLQELYYDGIIDGNINWERWACDRFAYNPSWLRFMTAPHPLTQDSTQRQAQRERDQQATNDRKFVNEQTALAYDKQYYPALLGAQATGMNVQYGDEVPDLAKPKKATTPKKSRAPELPFKPPPPVEAAMKHLTVCNEVERKSRIELGCEYHALRELGHRKELGKKADGKAWSFTQWSAVYIKRSRQDILACIKLYEETLSDDRSSVISQTPDVDPGPTNIVAMPRK